MVRPTPEQINRAVSSGNVFIAGTSDRVFITDFVYIDNETYPDMVIIRDGRTIPMDKLEFVDTYFQAIIAEDEGRKFLKCRLCGEVFPNEVKELHKINIAHSHVCPVNFTI